MEFGDFVKEFLALMDRRYEAPELRGYTLKRDSNRVRAGVELSAADGYCSIVYLEAKR
jgi:hypothetical protein